MRTHENHTSTYQFGLLDGKQMEHIVFFSTIKPIWGVKVKSNIWISKCTSEYEVNLFFFDRNP